MAEISGPTEPCLPAGRYATGKALQK